MQKLMRSFKRYRVWFILAAVAILTIILLSGTKIALYINFILGNDIVVKLSVDKGYLYLTRAQEEPVTFEASVTTNPFCKSICQSRFEDLSKGIVVEQDELTIQPGISIKKTYNIKADRYGEGVELYRFSMDCHSVKTLLCHTKELPNTRSSLVTVNYILTEEEKELKQELKTSILAISGQLDSLLTEHGRLADAFRQLNQSVIIPGSYSDINQLEKSTDDLRKQLATLKDIWNKQDYLLLQNETAKVQESQQQKSARSEEVNLSISDMASRYNGIIGGLDILRSRLESLAGMPYINQTFFLLANDSINRFNSVQTSIRLRSLMDDKERQLKGISDKVDASYDQIDTENSRDSILKTLDLYINYDSLCALTNICLSHPDIVGLSDKTQASLSETCSDIDDFNALLDQLMVQNEEAILGQAYPEDDYFWDNISLILDNAKRNVTNSYLEQLPDTGRNLDLIEGYLIASDLVEAEQFDDYNITPALIKGFSSHEPAGCSIIDSSNLSIIDDLELSHITFNTSIKETVPLGLTDPEPECCVAGKCSSCCMTEECLDDSSTYPVIFLHGHAVDKDLSAEYSLEGFNDIQDNLEEDGFLNAGSVTLYSIQDLPKDIWQPLNVPLTFRVSYYFDIFGQPENYIAIQTKSENIDTYSVRLKELVDSVLYKTKRPKVKIVTFSMGGLVARRYIQIFGDGKVDRLIMIGTPNKGIAGRISDYCPIIGGSLECSDMNSDSLFINKLNRDKLPDIPIYNIVGTGCSMEEGPGDGVVLESSALIEGAKNYVIKGKCRSTVYPLHLDLRDIDLYPEVYEIVLSVLT